MALEIATASCAIFSWSSQAMNCSALRAGGEGLAVGTERDVEDGVGVSGEGGARVSQIRAIYIYIHNLRPFN